MLFCGVILMEYKKIQTMVGRERFTIEKKKIVPNQNLVDTHPLKTKILKMDFKNQLKFGNSIASDDINRTITAIRTIASKTYSDAAPLYGLFTKHKIFETAEEQDQHLDWIFEQFHQYIDDAKALLKTHRADIRETIRIANLNK